MSEPPGHDVELRRAGEPGELKVIRRRDGRRTLETPRPLDSMAAAFAALAQLSLAQSNRT